MSLSYTTVTFNPGRPLNYLFTPEVLETADIPLPATVIGNDPAGSISIALVSSSNYDPGVLTWNVVVTVQDMDEIRMAGATVTGTSADLISLLQANGWTPPPDAAVSSDDMP